MISTGLCYAATSGTEVTDYGTPCRVDMGNVGPEPEAVLGVEAGGGFVQEHGFRVAHKSEGNVDAPSLATRKLLSLLGFQFRPRFPENY